MLYGTALRNQELCSLTLDQLDLGRHLVRLRRGKGNKGRVVPLGGEAPAWLELYLARVRPQHRGLPGCRRCFSTAGARPACSGPP